MFFRIYILALGPKLTMPQINQINYATYNNSYLHEINYATHDNSTQ
jgi:hypothetical protein